MNVEGWRPSSAGSGRLSHPATQWAALKSRIAGFSHDLAHLADQARDTDDAFTLIRAEAQAIAKLALDSRSRQPQHCVEFVPRNAHVLGDDAHRLRGHTVANQCDARDRSELVERAQGALAAQEGTPERVFGERCVRSRPSLGT